MVPIFRCLVRRSRLYEATARNAVVVQADEFLHRSTALVAPTSASARPSSFRPAITVDRSEGFRAEPTTVVDPQRLARSAGRLDAVGLQAVAEALALALELECDPRSDVYSAV